MRSHQRWLLLVAGLLVGFSALTPADAGKGYTPVAPAASLHAVFQSELKTLRGWINDEDFASALQSAQGLTVLAHLYSSQGSHAAWREKTTALAGVCSRLTTAARTRNGADCARLAQECARLLDALAATTPGPPEEKEFKPQGSTKTWMLLLDAAYSDAKTAKRAKDLELLAGAVAEEVNAYQFARADERWRKYCAEVRSAALTTADRARAGDLAGAKVALKGVYRGCEACHERNKK
jgi:hypothetical protein